MYPSPKDSDYYSIIACLVRIPSFTDILGGVPPPNRRIYHQTAGHLTMAPRDLKFGLERSISKEVVVFLSIDSVGHWIRTILSKDVTRLDT